MLTHPIFPPPLPYEHPSANNYTTTKTKRLPFNNNRNNAGIAGHNQFEDRYVPGLYSTYLRLFDH
jgi:hypothetical protein